MDISAIKEGITLYLILVIGITMHEFGHAYAAYKLGDNMPKLMGRVTLNPIAHMDFWGTFIIPLVAIMLSLSGGGIFLIGWGKPVIVSLPNPKTRVRDDLLSTAAGPAMNLVMALISAIVAGILFKFNLPKLANIAALSVFLNCMLFVFNMLPLPPLDGSHFLKYAVGMSNQTYAYLSRYSFIILLVLINIPQFRYILSSIVGIVSSVFIGLAGMIGA